MTLQPLGLIPPDVETTFAAYLRTFLAARPEAFAQSVYVGKSKPTTNRPRTIAVRRDGGQTSGILTTPRLTIRVWADLDDEASDLARLVVAAVLASPGNAGVVSVRGVFGPTPIPEAGQPQYMVNAEITMRGTAL